MGRKKRKVAVAEPEAPPDAPVLPVESSAVTTKEEATPAESPKKKESSNYAVTSHSAEIIGEDIYISDGSESEEEFEISLSSSKMGLMRRGLHMPTVAAKRQWTRAANNADESAANGSSTKHEEDGGTNFDDDADLDPAERAARKLLEEQKKAEQEQIQARIREAEENAGRDSMLFSKRTAFDIRFESLDDKPWERGDITDFFNYGMNEEDWLEYSQQQLMIRQELIDARRQKRQADPTIVPVTPREPTRAAEAAANKNAATSGKPEDVATADADAPGGSLATAGPERPPGPEKPAANANEPAVGGLDAPDAGAGGAWGSAPAELIEAQERESAPPSEDRGHYGHVPPSDIPPGHYGQHPGDENNRGSYGHHRPPPPPSGQYGGGEDYTRDNYHRSQDYSYNDSGGYHGHPPPPPQQQYGGGGYYQQPQAPQHNDYRGGSGRGRGGYSDRHSGGRDGRGRSGWEGGRDVGGSRKRPHHYR